MQDLILEQEITKMMEQGKIKEIFSLQTKEWEKVVWKPTYLIKLNGFIVMDDEINGHSEIGFDVYDGKKLLHSFICFKK